MENNLGIQIFSHEIFGSVRTIDENGKVWFNASDVTKALGYGSSANALKRHCKGVSKRHILTSGGKQLVNFISEGDLYRLITHSKLPSAQQFESWVFDGILVEIRKNGGYIVGQENMSNEEILAKAMIVANNIIEEKNKLIAKQEERLKLQKPFADVGKQLLKSDDKIYIGDMAKVLCNDDTNVGRNRLFKCLRDNKILMKKRNGDNVPYQEYINKGYFFVQENVGTRNGVTHISLTTLVTSSGQDWLIKKFKNLYNN